MPVKRRGSSIATPSRPEFSVQDFDELIKNYGYDVRWSKFMVCPNYDPVQPDHHLVSCTLCDHAGRVFYDPQVTRMFASSFALSPKYAPESRYDHGTCYFTTSPGARVSFRDRIEMLSSLVRYSERVILSVATTYYLRFPVIAVQGILNNHNVTVDPATVTVNSNGSITFPSAPAGEILSVSYDHHPVYSVIDVLHIVRDSRITVPPTGDTPAEFNRQVVAQLEIMTDTQGNPNIRGEG